MRHAWGLFGVAVVVAALLAVAPSAGAAAGDLDAGFNPNANGIVREIAVLSDGDILIAGDFTTVGGVARTGIARLNADGTLDTDFANPNLDGEVYAMAEQGDG